MLKKRVKININKRAVFIAVFSLFILFQIFSILKNITLGVRLAELEDKKNRLLKENEELSSSLVSLSSLSNIQRSADELGFAKPVRVIYMDPSEPVAEARTN